MTRGKSGLVKPLLLSGAAGGAWALALPSWHWVGLLPVGALCLAYGFKFLRSAGKAFLTGTFTGFCHWLVGVFWVVEVMTHYGHLSGPVAFAALGLMSLILGLFWGVAFWAAYRVLGAWRPLVLALGLSAGEMAQGLPPWNFPWNPMAAAFVPWPELLASLSILGTTLFGLLVRVLLLAGAFGFLHKSLKFLRIAGGAGAVLLVATLAAGKPSETGPAVLAAAVQPNVPLEVRWDWENLPEIEERVWRLTLQAVSQGAKLLVWPESAVPRLLERDEQFRSQLMAFSRKQQAWLVLNSIGFGNNGAYFNSMYLVSPSEELHRYDKVHLVPFGEYVPPWAQLFFLRPLVREVGGFTPGRTAHLLPGPWGSMGGAVCYEVAFPMHAASQVRSGAGLLVSVTNDGWYGESSAPYQHLALAILRAIENRRYLIRAANTGISAIIAPDGRITKKLGIGAEGVLLDQVIFSSGVCPAAALAEFLHLAPVLVFGTAILLLVRQR